MRLTVAALIIAPILALVPASYSGLVMPWATPDAPAPVVGAAPVAAPRPAVAAAARDAAALTLASDLEQLIQNTGWPGDQWSVMVVSLDRGDTLFNHNGDAALAPASNLKLYTTAAALYYLGPEFRYSTFLLTDGKIESGVLSGDLIVYGTGDPSFTGRFGSRDGIWHAFADSLVAQGVREVRGDVVGDGSYFAGPGTGAGWQEDYMNASYAAPSSALSYAENVATLEIRPAAQPGWRPEVTLANGADGLAVVNDAQTVARGRSWIHVTRSAYDGPIVVRGQISRGTVSLQRSIPVSDPPRFAAAVFKQILLDKGVTVTGTVRSVTEAAQSPVTGRLVFAPALDASAPMRVIAIYQSPALIEILDVVNKKSHNLMAEQALRTVGRVAIGEGSVTAGEKAVQQLLKAETGTFADDLRMDDGSGLSVLNRTSARSLVHLLSFMAKSPMWDAYWQTLPEAGVWAGGLRRMGGTAAASNLRAKTGTIDRVSSLSGYVSAANGERLAFAIISNNVPSTWRAKRVEDAIGVRLAAFSRDVNGNELITARESAAPRPIVATRRYTIRRGDNLERIARRHGTTVAALQRVNPGVNPRRLIPGQTLRLP